MPHPGEKCSDDEFMEFFPKEGTLGLKKRFGLTERVIFRRRRMLEIKHNITIPAPLANEPIRSNHPGRINLKILNGQVIVGSDFHIWPGEESTCLRAFKKFVEDVKPEAIILNGDVMDFPRISRFPQNWEKAPDPIDEIEAAQDHLNDIVQRSKKGAEKIWTQGNHDARFENMVANALPAMRGIRGVHLSDHFTIWQKAMSCFVNESMDGGATMIKHRFKGGIHAARNNALNAGISMVTGHLHSQNVRPISDYNRFDRYGIDTGCVADKNHRAFNYTEDSPLDWRSGFALLTYRDGKLLYPELITKWDDESVQFRGQIIKV